MSFKSNANVTAEVCVSKEGEPEKWELLIRIFPSMSDTEFPIDISDDSFD